ncbi:hypothetical protein P4E94_02400 [Pontiellaceae bacterium B12219]|nr:hypothetical protein [Pontiellaceae bacterium B12219]
MKKQLISLVLLLLLVNAFAGEVGKPLERLALPEVQGSHLVCIWDESAGAWLQGFEGYDLSGTYEFQLPEWNRWYWIGLWDETKGEYVYEKWIGHFIVSE